MNWTDEHIDNLYRKRSEDLNFEYKDAYWAEMESMLSDADALVSEEVTDAEIDAIYQEEAEELSFAYKSQYWQEFEAMLPRKRRLDFLWFFTSLFFIGLIGLNAMKQDDLISPDKQIHTTASNLDVTNQNSQNKGTDEDHSANVESQQAQLVWDPSSLELSPLNFGANTIESDRGFYSTYTDDPGVSISDNQILVGTPGVLDGKLDKYATEDNSELNNIDVGQLPIKELEEEEANRELMPYEGKVSSMKSIYVQGIGGLSQSLISPSDALSYSYGIGVGFILQKRQFTFAAGLNGLVSNHSDLQLNRSAKVYGFGSEIYNYNINYKQLYILEGNLEFGYRYKRHQFKLSVRPSYALSSKVRIRQNEASYDGIDMVEVNENEDIYGFMDGLKRFGVRPGIGYAFSITPSLEFGLNVGTQLFPQVNADYLDGENNRLPIDGQFYLRKSFRFGK